jgi:hypothetical protein
VKEGTCADDGRKQAYIVRWVKVEEGHTISWSVQPHKKSMYVICSITVDMRKADTRTVTLAFSNTLGREARIAHYFHNHLHPTTQIPPSIQITSLDDRGVPLQ